MKNKPTRIPDFISLSHGEFWFEEMLNYDHHLYEMIEVNNNLQFIMDEDYYCFLDDIQIAYKEWQFSKKMRELLK